ncbi:MAG: hypothetical protein SFZ23_12940 [Planctomycetota bacterium]|nr:hypothetical protein [Planctomycetota bacterium]
MKIMRSSFALTGVAALLAVAGAASSARAQVLVGVDDATTYPSSCYVYNFSTQQWVGVFSGVQVWGLAADDANRKLYIASSSNNLYEWNYSDFGNNTVPTLLGTFTFNGANTNFVGLAFNPSTGRLYGVRNIGTEGIYEIDIATRVATLLFTYNSAYDIGGLDYNPADGFLYGTNDAATDRGLVRFDLTAQTATVVSGYPTFAGNGGTTPDIDGLAVGRLPGGDLKAYFLVDQTGETGVYNFATAGFEAPFTNPWPTGASETFSGGAWAANLLAPPAGSDVSITMTDSPDPVIPPGGNITYTITVRNNGPELATGVNVTNVLPGNVTFVSATPPAVFNSGTISASFASIPLDTEQSFQVVVQSGAAGTVTNTASVTAASEDNNQSNNSATANTTVRNQQANLAVTVTDPADCSVGPGGEVIYTVALNNTGPEAADNTNLVITLPSNADFVSALPAATPVNGVITYNLGSISNGGGGNFIITTRAQTANSTLQLTAEASSSTEDPNAANNIDAETTLIQPEPPTSVVGRGVISTVASSTTSDVPGLAAKYTDFRRPYPSPNGQRWAMSVDTDISTTGTDDLVITGSGATVAVAAQQGVTQFPDFSVMSSNFDSVVAINDSGDFAFSGDTNAATTADEVALKSVGGTLSFVAQEGTAVPSIAGATFGTSTTVAGIDPAGRVAVSATSLGGVATGVNAAVLRDDGNVVVAQKGVDIPTGQDGGATATWDLFDIMTNALGASFNPLDHTDESLTGEVGIVTTTDNSVVINNAVQIQQGVAPLGLPTGVSTIGFAQMFAGGYWGAYGSNSGTEDWVIGGDAGGNAQLLAATGQPITPGSSETWGDASFTQTFFYAIRNGRGDSLIGGVTTGAPNARSNAVLVLNGKEVVLRENDAIDLNGDGINNDGTYLSVFRDDLAFLNDCRQLYIVVRFRDELEALCDTGDNDIGQGLIVVQLPLAADFNDDGQVDFFDFLDFAAAFSSEDPAADFNDDGQVDFFDYLDFAAAFAFEGECGS